jgi:DNA-directed RNA polymerase beta' subunit
MDRRTVTLREEDDMARYGKKTQETVKETMEKFKKGELKSGNSAKKVKSRKQAIAIGLSEAREKGGKVPPVSKKSK